MVIVSECAYTRCNFQWNISYCTNLKLVSIGSRVTRISEYVFCGCNNLDIIYMNPVKAPATPNTFSGVPTKTVLCIPDGATGYDIAPWTQFKQKKLRGISITKQPTKKKYAQYTRVKDLDLTGMVVTATFNDGTTALVPITLDNISDFDSSKPVIDQKVKVTVCGLTAFFTVSIIKGTVYSLAGTNTNTNATVEEASQSNYKASDSAEIISNVKFSKRKTRGVLRLKIWNDNRVC